MGTTTSKNKYPFLEGGGELGERTRQYDWSQTSIGTPDYWPPSLRTTLSIILNSRFPMFLWWGDELIQFYNDAYRPSLGNSGKHPTALGQRGQECWPEIWPVIKPLIDQVLAGGESTWSEDQLIPIYRNGRLDDVYWTFSYSPVKDESGQPAGVLVTCTETTEKIINLQRLTESKDQLEFAIEAAELGTWDLNPFTNKFTANARLKGWFGLLPEDEVELTLATDAIVVRDRQRVIDAIQQALQYDSGGHYEIDYTIVHPATGIERIVRAKGKAWFTDEKIAYRFNGTLQDSTAERKAQEDKTAAQQLAELAIKSSGVGLFRVDLTSEHIDYSPAYAAIITGDATKKELTREAFAKYIHPDDKSIRDTVTNAGIKTGEIYYQPRVIWDDGSIHYISVLSGLVFDEEGRPIAYSGTVKDITEQEKQAQALKEAEASLRGAIEMAELATWAMDAATSTLTYSERLKGWFGFRDEETVYNTAYNPVIEQDRDRIKEALLNALIPESGGGFDVESTIIEYRTGRKRILRAQGKIQFDSAGKPIRLTGTAQDVTEQRQLQLALEQQVQERTEELGAINEELAATNEELTESNKLLIRSNDNLEKFAYIASHDLQEPLRKIQQFGDLLKVRYAELTGDELVYLERMQLAASRMSTLIRDLLTFSRISTRQDTIRPVSLTEIIHSVLTDLELRIQETGAVVKVGQLPTIPGDALQLGQLFLNLLSNALKFRKEDVTPIITVSVQEVQATDLPLSVKPTRMAKLYHRIDVSDNGIGFDEKYLDRIFQVFQRLHSKNEFAGTGIGLAICEKVAANHGGAITATSQPGQGATFSVFFPY